MLSSTIIGIPTGDKDFEEKCVPLFAGLLGDPNVKTVGASGYSQRGLDLIGRRGRDPNQPVGIQCKLKTKKDRLTEQDVREEVEKALTVEPLLTEYYIVTTASDNTDLDLLAMSLSQEQARGGRLIDIQVWGWETLQQKIRADHKALRAFDPGHSPATDELLRMGVESLQATTTLQESQVRYGALVQEIHAAVIFSPVDPARGVALEAHLDSQVDQYRDLINDGRPRTALDLLQRLESQLSPASSPAIRARVRANMGWARIRLGEDGAGGQLLLEAFDINPADPKVVSNRILGLILTDDPIAALKFALDLLAADPENSRVAAFAFNAAAVVEGADDPSPSIAPSVLDEIGVSIHRISFLRTRGETDSWRRLAAEVYAAYPTDDAAAQFAAEALLDAAFENRTFERNPVLPLAKLEGLREGVAILGPLWEKVRKFENAGEPYLVSMAVNLANAYRALAKADDARRIVDEALAVAPDNPDALATAYFLAVEKDDFERAAAFVERFPDRPSKTIHLLNVLARKADWAGVREVAERSDREALSMEDRQIFDTLVFRATAAAALPAEAEAKARVLLAAWPESVGAHVIASDVVGHVDSSAGDELATRAVALLNSETPYGDRLMLAQLAGFRADYETLIRVLDGYVQTDEPSWPLARLAWAFANASPRPGAHRFFESLGEAVLHQPQFARLAGHAEASRGDLKAAESHFRRALDGDPADLRAQLELHSVLQRANRPDAARSQMLAVDELQVDGDPMDKMRLAHILRRYGEAERALTLGYSVARANRANAEVSAAFPPLLLLNTDIPAEVSRVGPLGKDMWFDFAGSGTADVKGVIEDSGDVGDGSYASDHPLVTAAVGKSIGEQVTLERPLGPSLNYTIRDLKHKYVWLMQDIMHSHDTNFPESNALVSFNVEDGNVQPILDVVKKMSEHDRVVAKTYFDFPVPLAVVAAMSKKSVVELAEHLPTIDSEVRTCLGSEPERKRATWSVRAARGKGAVLDTLALWTAHRLGLLGSLQAYFGRLVVPRSTMDDLLDLRAQKQIHQGRQYFTIGYIGEQAVKDVHTVEDTDRIIGIFDAAIADVEAYCEVLPTDGADDLRLDDEIMDQFAAGSVLDPIHQARAEKLLLLSEDYRLRELAAAYGVAEGAWLQPAFRALTDAGLIEEPDYCVAVGRLSLMRHGHVWLDSSTLMGIRSLDAPLRDVLFDAALKYIGGPSADLVTHAGVVLNFMEASLKQGEPTGDGRAFNLLLTRLISGQPLWREILGALDLDLIQRMSVTGHPAVRARDYLHGWMRGHFIQWDARLRRPK